MIRGPKKNISILVPLELYEKLKGLSQANGWPLGRYVRQVLRRYVRYAEEHQNDPEDNWIIKK